jgi:DNA invertase Pin-like site-specific DNA recombinase
MCHMQVFGYTRVSGKGQVEGDGHPRQITAILHSAGSQVPVKVLSDDAVPGKTDADERPQFQALLAECQAGDTVIVESLDRLARSYAVQERLLSLLVSKEIKLIAANTGEDVTAAFMGDPMRRALIQIQGIFAELDKNLIIQKLSKARKRMRDRGQRCEGRKPYGFHARETETLFRIQKMSRDGYSPSHIAGILNLEHVRPRSGDYWFPATVRKILRREHAIPNDTDRTKESRLRVSE